MKEFVLLNTHTSDLYIGYRVCFTDGYRPEITYKIHQSTGEWGKLPKVTIGQLAHHGWVITHPNLPYPVFFSINCEKFLENLGEL